jgi:hypothetical protein
VDDVQSTRVDVSVSPQVCETLKERFGGSLLFDCQLLEYSGPLGEVLD